MIAGIFHQGSGLGNQLHRYVGTRVLAIEAGEKHGMVAPELFKGKDFMDLECGSTGIRYAVEQPSGKVVMEDMKGITVVDGEFQSPAQFIHKLNVVDKWLKVEPLEVPDDTCIINFRGGEYSLFPEFFLPRSYWVKTIDKMNDLGIKKFEVHTDDKELAEEWFDFPVVQDISINWRSLRYAKHTIISNSSFAILPRLLNGGMTLAPNHWVGYNKGYWQEPNNYYEQFTYV